jgi:hypothetical protein
MPRAELVPLLKRICNARWGEVALMSKEERLEAGKLKLWHIGLTNEDANKAIAGLEKAFDREIGKAAQTVAMTVESKGIDKLQTDRLLALERHLAQLTGANPLIIPPPPQKLVDNYD